MATPPSRWVIDKVREYVADGLTCPLVAEQLTALGHPCTARAVRRWKSQHGIQLVSTITDAQLDAMVQQAQATGVMGEAEGYRWVVSEVNKRVAPQRVGEKRVLRSLQRVDPAGVARRKKLIERRLIRRVYSMQYYLQAGHIDYNCKATLPGGVRLYSYGHVRAEHSNLNASPTLWSCEASACVQVDGDSRWVAALEVTFVKTSKAAFEEGFVRAIERPICSYSDTADSIVAAQAYERRMRGSQALAED